MATSPCLELTYDACCADGGLWTSINRNGLRQFCQYSGHFDCKGKNKGQNEKERKADAALHDSNRESRLRAVIKVIVHRECADCNCVIEIFFVLIVTFKIRVSGNIIIRPYRLLQLPMMFRHNSLLNAIPCKFWETNSYNQKGVVVFCVLNGSLHNLANLS